jgi:hypothetical protein
LRKEERASKRLSLACGLVHAGFASQLFNQRGQRQATIDETGMGFDLLNKEDYSNRGGGRRPLP